MTNRDIYISALRLIGEDPYTDTNPDYEERAPYLLAAFCSEAASVDAAYREMKGLENAESFDTTYLSLDGDFPFADRLTSTASMYLAAMLVIDENLELSDKLFDKYCDSMATIQSEIPSKIEKIVQKYSNF